MLSPDDGWRYVPVYNRCQEKYLSAFATPTRSLINLAHLTDDFCMPFQSRCIRKLVGLPDHLICQDEERRGERDPEGLGGLEVEDQLELRGLLHREVRRFGTLEDFV